MTSHIVYILECSNGAYYTGYTTDLCRRYAEHCQGTAKCKYTRSFPPVKIAAAWQVEPDVSMALSLERTIKRLTKEQKKTLIDNPDSLITITSITTKYRIINCGP